VKNEKVRLILASSSPRRQALLSELGVRFEVFPSDLPELWPEGPPDRAVESLALKKARAIASRLPAGIVLGADTVVVLGEEVFGKPRDAGDARRMLLRLRAKTHRVITGLALVEAGGRRETVASVSTDVTMRRYDDTEIERYIRSGEPFDKAGAYAIQGEGGALVERVDGCYTNVVGLPLTTTRRLLESWGVLKREA
jgi:septum formation protein